MARKKLKAIFQLRATLRGIEPSIWRAFQVPEDIKLRRLHTLLQLLFDWEDYHLHDFIVGRVTYSVPDPEDADFGRKVQDERLVPLNQIVNYVGDRFEYHYDFGDNWRHDVQLEAILLPSAEASYPICVGGSRNAPPEDTGGPSSYPRYLEALANPTHQDHEEKLAWRGPFNPEAFSIDATNASLKRAFYPRSPAQRAAAKAAETTDFEHLVTVTAFAPQRSAAPQPTTHSRGNRKVVLELTDRERELILQHSPADDALTRQLRIVPKAGEPVFARYTLANLDEMAGRVASESSRAANRKLRKEWSAIYKKIAAILEAYPED